MSKYRNRRKEYEEFKRQTLAGYDDSDTEDPMVDIDNQRRDYNDNLQGPPAVMFRELDKSGIRRPSWEQMKAWVAQRYFSSDEEAEQTLQRWQEMGEFTEEAPNEYAPTMFI